MADECVCGMTDGNCSMHGFCCNSCSHGRGPNAPPVRTRDQLLARLADVLRRSGVEDAEDLIRAAEQAMPAPPRGLAPLALTPTQANAVLRLTFLPAGTVISEPIDTYSAGYVTVSGDED